MRCRMIVVKHLVAQDDVVMAHEGNLVFCYEAGCCVWRLITQLYNLLVNPLQLLRIYSTRSVV